VTESLPVDGRSLTLDQFLSVVRGRSAVSLAGDARTAMAASRAVVEAAVRRGRAIYGVTTGFGQLSDKIVPPDQARALQLSLVRSHSSGAGDPLPEEVVRGILLVRANSLARGHSGVRPVVVETLLALLNRRLVPFVPSQGSVGASGDLAPLAHVALALIGEGEFVGPDGRRTPAAAALVDHGIAPLELAEKEGVALVNGTSLMASYLALAVADASDLLDAATVAAAVSFDALEGNPEALDDRLGRLEEHDSAAEADLRSRLDSLDTTLLGRVDKTLAEANVALVQAVQKGLTQNLDEKWKPVGESIETFAQGSRQILKDVSDTYRVATQTRLLLNENARRIADLGRDIVALEESLKLVVQKTIEDGLAPLEARVAALESHTGLGTPTTTNGERPPPAEP